MSTIVTSKNGVPIRLPDERWEHILAKHPELAEIQATILDIVANPDRVLEGQTGELLAIRELVSGKWLVVACREFPENGFVITAYTTRRISQLEKRIQL